MEVEKQQGQPCQLRDLPWPATATPPLGESQLSLAPSHHRRPLLPLPLPFSLNLLLSSVFFCLNSLNSWSLVIFKSYPLIKQQADSCFPCLFSPLLVAPASSHHRMARSVRLSGVNMQTLGGLKYPPLPGKQQQCRQPSRLVTSLFFDPPTFLQRLTGRQELRIHSGHASTMSNDFGVFHHCQHKTRPAKKNLAYMPPPTLLPNCLQVKILMSEEIV